MSTMILAFVVMLVLTLGMAVGVLCGRKPIAGSCGGMSALGFKTECEICGGNKDVCEDEQKKQSVKAAQAAADLAYDATNPKGQ